MPSDYGHEFADKELKKLESKLTKEYKQAAAEVEKKMKDFLSKFEEKDKKMLAKVQSGDMTAKEYAEWRKGQIMTGKRWEDMRDTLSQDLVNADKIAAGMINDFLPNAYAENMNFGTYEVESGVNIDTGFTLYDKNTVKNLMKKDPQIIPQARVDIPKDELWNRRKLTSAVMQGILQGESIPNIAKRLRSVADMDRNAAIRNARTYTTAAENKGRVDSYERAKDMGIPVKQMWMATLDDRTRVEHRHLDGQVREIGEEFEADGYKIRYPGDPSAEPEMIYCCRCTLVADLPKYGKDLERNESKLGDMTYEEWKHGKEKENNNTFASNIEYSDALMQSKYDEQRKIINNLVNEYDTRLKSVSTGAEKSAGDVDITGKTMRINTTNPDTAIHEFVHTLANTNADKYGLTDDKEFWKEIKSVRRKYMKDVQYDTSRWISSYEHSSNKADEFLAEAFTQAKMIEMGLPLPNKYGNDLTYSHQVLEIVDKYFKRKKH